MSCLSERIAGAIIFLLSGYAFAGDLAIDSPEEMTVASIAPMPVRTLPPIPEPQRYAFEYQPDQGHPFYAPVENFYSMPITHDVRFGSATPASMPGPASQQAPSQASNYLSLGPSTAPQLSLADVQNTTLTLGAQPQRRLSLTVNDWAFSATARVAVLHSHSTGATLSVRHGF